MGNLAPRCLLCACQRSNCPNACAVPQLPAVGLKKSLGGDGFATVWQLRDYYSAQTSYQGTQCVAERHGMGTHCGTVWYC